MLKYTGHPIVDVGVATITAFADKDDPSELTEQDFAAIADYMEQQYSKNPMKSFLTVIFVNSDFTQTAFDSQPARRHAYADRVLRAWHPDRQPLDTTCVFFGTPAIEIADSKMLTLSGSNFYPGGIEGLPVSGEALLAIQAFTLGCIKCEGRVLLIHADNPKVTAIFARRALERNMNALSLSSQVEKQAGAKYPRTQIISGLVEAEQLRQDYELCSITAYHLTNYRTKPAIDLYHLPLQTMSFLWQVTEASYKEAWNRLVRRAWHGGLTADGGDVEQDELGFPARRNVLYEDLFALPQDARRFLRTYLLRMPRVQGTTKDDQRRTYHLETELDLVSWPLAKLFMKEVMNVDEGRITAIRIMADKIADYISTSGDIPLFKMFLYGGSRGQDYQDLRTKLIRADYAVAPFTGPLFTLDEFLATFETTDDRFWWLMARDLMLIRMIEKMYQEGKIEAVREVLAPPPEAAQDDEV